MPRAHAFTLLLLAACQRRSPDDEGPAACDATFAADLEATLARACPVAAQPVVSIALATAPGPSTDPMPDGIPVTVTSSGVSMSLGDGEPIALSELRPIVEQEFQKAKEWKEGKADHTPTPFILLVAKDAPLGRVAEVVDMLGSAGHHTGALVMASATQPNAAPPRYPKTFARLQEKANAPEADKWAKQLAEVAREAVDDCEPAREILLEVQRVPAAERCPMLAAKMPAAIVECDCNRAAELTSLAQMLSAVDAPVLQADSVVLDRTAAIAVDPAQLWGDFVAAHTTGFERLWFNPTRVPPVAPSSPAVGADRRVTPATRLRPAR